VPLSSAERIPLLQQGKLDFVATSMTRTPERLREVDFSHITFVTPHAVIVKKSSGITAPVVGPQGLLGEHVHRRGELKRSPRFGRTIPPASRAPLLKGGGDHPTDETVLAAIVRQDGHPEDYLFLPDFAQSRNVGFAMKEDEPRMQAAIALPDIEASGEAAKIREAWFGPGAEQPMKRTFRITAEC